MSKECSHGQKETDEILVKRIGPTITYVGYRCSKCLEPVFPFEEDA